MLAAVLVAGAFAFVNLVVLDAAAAAAAVGTAISVGSVARGEGPRRTPGACVACLDPVRAAAWDAWTGVGGGTAEVLSLWFGESSAGGSVILALEVDLNMDVGRDEDGNAASGDPGAAVNVDAVSRVVRWQRRHVVRNCTTLCGVGPAGEDAGNVARGSWTWERVWLMFAAAVNAPSTSISSSFVPTLVPARTPFSFRAPPLAS